MFTSRVRVLLVFSPSLVQAMFKWDMDHHIKFSYIVFFWASRAPVCEPFATSPHFHHHHYAIFFGPIQVFHFSTFWFYDVVPGYIYILQHPEKFWLHPNCHFGHFHGRSLRSATGQEQPIMERLSEPRMDLRADARSLRALPMGWDTIRNRKWRALNCVYWWLVMGFQLLHTVTVAYCCGWFMAQKNSISYLYLSRQKPHESHVVDQVVMHQGPPCEDIFGGLRLLVREHWGGERERERERERDRERERERERERAI